MQRVNAEQYKAIVEKKEEKPSKYFNVRTVYNGRKYQSKREAAWAAHLDRLHARGLITGWVPQKPRFKLCTNPETKKDLTYTADFLVHLPDGRQLVLDAKGMDSAESRLRRAIVYEKYSISVLTEWRDVIEIIEGRV